MPRDAAAVRVYTVCDESKCAAAYPTLHLTHAPLFQIDFLIRSHRRCTPMDAEDCDPYTDVFFIKFSHVSNARFAKRKLDEYVFLGNRLQVSYAPQFETLLDTKEKLEVRRKEVLGRMKSSSGRPEGLSHYSPGQGSSAGNSHHQMSSNKSLYVSVCIFQTQHYHVPTKIWEYTKTLHASQIEDPIFSRVSSNKDYFPSKSMNATVNLVREKLDKIQSSTDNSNAVVTSKKPRTDNRRRI
uniref:RNA-binding protein 48 n=1 Tax=Leersia perrieri TaxID=77586 RepID=A0A0D9VB47_9ORYZ